MWTDNLTAFAVGPATAMRTQDGGQSWQDLGVSVTFGFNEVYSPQAGTVVLLGNSERWVSTDGGQNFSHQSFGFAASFYNFRTLVLSPTHLLRAAFGEGAEIWESLDGGTNWTMLSIRPQLGYTDVIQIPTGRIFVCRSDGQIEYSDDLWQSQLVPPGNLITPDHGGTIVTMAALPNGVLYASNSQSFPADSSSWFRSDDGGNSWFLPGSWHGQPYLQHLLFLDNNTGIGASGSQIVYTQDGGDSWLHSSLPPNTSVFQLARSGARCWAACTINPQSGSALYFSDDGGATWQLSPGSPANTVQAGGLFFLNDSTAFFSSKCVDGGCLYTSTDSGQSWSTQALPQFNYAFVDMVWTSTQHGVALMRNSSLSGIYLTTDGGATWERRSEIRCNSLYRHPNGQLAAIPVSGSDILFSDDGGQSWNAQTIPYGGVLQLGAGSSLCLLPRPNGWLVGSQSSRILEMTVSTTSLAAPELEISYNSGQLELDWTSVDAALLYRIYGFSQWPMAWDEAQLLGESTSTQFTIQLNGEQQMFYHVKAF